MFFSKSTIVSFGLLATSQLVAGHAAITGATGDQGGQGSAIGVDPATPRDGTRRNPFQQDSTRFRNEAADQCGETLGGGTNDVQTGTAQVMAQNGGTLPQVSAGGQLQMTVHQVNSDGAGPYTCMIDATGTGTQWTPIQVTQNIDGNARGRNNDQQKQDLPLNVAIPANQQCNGTVAGQSNVCMVRCENPARAGPFGGCVPIQMAGAGAAAGGAAAGGANAGAANAGAAQTGANAGAAGAAGNANAGTANANTGATGAAAGNAAGANAAGTANTGAAAGTANTGAAAGNTAGTAGTAGTANTGAAAGTANTANTGAAAGGKATGAATPALTNDDQEEEVTRRQTTPALTDDDQEEEVDLLDGQEAKKIRRSFWS